jgi:hypothetical protein
VVARAAPVRVDVTATAASGTTPPEESVTVPEIVPVISCAGTETPIETNITAITIRRAARIVILPGECLEISGTKPKRKCGKHRSVKSIVQGDSFAKLTFPLLSARENRHANFVMPLPASYS